MHKSKNIPLDNSFEQTPHATLTMFANEVFRSGYYIVFLGIKGSIFMFT